MAERNEIPNRMTALGLLEQMRRSNANRQAPFDPVAASARERRAAPAASSGQRPQAPLPLPPTPPTVIPPPQPQQAAPQVAALQSRQRASNLPIPPTPPQLDEQGNPIYIPPALLPRTAGESGATYERFNPQNPYVATATQMAEKYNLPPNVLLSMLYRESRFRPDAISPVGAIGIGQLMPGTAAELRVNPYNPTENIEGSARYLRQMLDLHKGDMPLALASYNAGPGRVRQAGNTIPSIKETQAYVPGVLRDAGVPGYAHGGLAHLEHKYAEGGRIGRAVGLIRRAVTPELEAARIPSEPARSVFPAPQRFFDPEDRAYKPSLQDFEYEPGGRYLEMRRGESPRDITGESVDNARISVGPNGRPSMMVGEPTDLPTGSPGRGSTTTKTNLFKRSAGWKWTDAPEGYADIPTLVSVENRNQHYYALSADYPRGVDLSRYPDSKQEPRLRPTTQGNVYPGSQVGTISVRGREHPVYDNVTVRQVAPVGMVGAAAASGEDDAPASLEHLDHKYAAGDLVVVPGVATPIPGFDYHVRANRIRQPRTHRPAPREELTANQLNDMVLDRIAGRAAPAMEVGAPAEARERIGRTMGYDDGGLVQPHVSGGGSGTRVGNARIVGYGGNAGLDAQVGGGRLDTSISGQGMSSHAGGHHRRHHRVEGVNLGYTTPSGDRFTLGFHDRLMALPDTLPGANPMEVERGMSPSRGVRVGFSREFADGGLAELEHKYEGGGSVISTVRDVGGQIVDAMIPRTPLDFALYAAMGPGSRLVKLLGTTGLAMLEPSEARGRQRAPEPEYLIRRPRHEMRDLEELDQRYADGGDVMSDEEYDRRLLGRMQRDMGRTDVPSWDEQRATLVDAAGRAARGVFDVVVPQTPLDVGLTLATGPVGSMVRRGAIAGAGYLLDPDEAQANVIRRVGRALGRAGAGAADTALEAAATPVVAPTRRRGTIGIIPEETAPAARVTQDVEGYRPNIDPVSGRAILPAAEDLLAAPRSDFPYLDVPQPSNARQNQALLAERQNMTPGTGNTYSGNMDPLVNERVIFRGREPREWSPSDWGAYGRQYGTDRLGPVDDAAWQASLREYDAGGGQRISIPGGLDSTEPFTYYDQLFLKSQGIDPSQMPRDMHIALQRRILNSVTPDADDPVAAYNGLMMGFASPNNPLFPNQIAMTRLRARSPEDIERLADMLPWRAGDDVSKADRAAFNRRIAEVYGLDAGPQAAVTAREAIPRVPGRRAREAVVDENGRVIQPAQPARAARDARPAREAEEATIGGTGARGSPDYTRIAEFAQMYRDRPDFFRFNPDPNLSNSENWSRFVERIVSQVPGLSAKTGSFGAVWQEPATAAISAIDRHMANQIGSRIFPDRQALEEFNNRVITKWNNSLTPAQRRTDRVSNIEDLTNNDRGNTFLQSELLSAVGQHSGMRVRNPRGGLNPNLPSHLTPEEANWVREPRNVATLGSHYREALSENARMAEQEGLGLFGSQWLNWDRIRRRLEPHENMNPVLSRIPPMALEQLQDARLTHRAMGSTDYTKVRPTPEQEAAALRAGDNVNASPRLKPTSRVANPSGLGYFAAPPLVAGSLAREGEPAPSLEELDQRYADGGPVMSDEEYDRRLLSRMKAQTGRTTESTNAEQARALRSAGYDAAQLASDIFLPQSPLDAALMVALGPGPRMARLAGSAALAALEPSEAEAGGLRRLIRAYHGSPHRFDEFDIRKIGTGEGNQTYGHGLYFAENEDVAKHYIDPHRTARPVSETMRISGRTINEVLPDVPDVIRRMIGGGLVQNSGDLNRALASWNSRAAEAPNSLSARAAEAADRLRGLNIEMPPRPGHMYEVNLNASPRDFLNWEAPLNRQSPDVRESLQRFNLSANPTGKEIYQQELRMDPEEARMALMQSGIPGTRYYDAGSRAIGGGTNNYVVFDPEIIDITRRYAQGGLAQLEHKYADGGIVNGGATPYDPDAVNALANQIEAGYV